MDPIVSSDIIKDPRASVVDLGMTQVVDGDLVKVMSWARQRVGVFESVGPRGFEGRDRAGSSDREGGAGHGRQCSRDEVSR